MSASHKLFARMQRSADGWGASDLDRLYQGFGFDSREGARHTVYIHPRYPHLRAVVPRHSYLAKAYIADAVKLIKELRQLEKANEGTP